MMIRLRRLPLLALLAAAPAAAGPVWVVSQQGAALVRVEAGSVRDRTALGPAPVAAAVDDAGRVYVAHPDGRAVTVVEPGREPRRIPVPAQVFGLAASPDGAWVYVGDWSGDRVLKVASATGAVAGTAAVGHEPAHLVLDRRGRLYVADRESRQVSVVDAAAMTRVATVPTGEAPFALALDPAGTRLYVANVRSNDLTVIDTATLQPRATVPAGAAPYGVALTGDGARVLVTNQHAGTVTVIDAASLAIVASVTVGAYPEGIAVAEGRAYVANWFSDDVSVIDLATLRETARIPVAEGPRGLVAGPDPGAAQAEAAGRLVGVAGGRPMRRRTRGARASPRPAWARSCWSVPASAPPTSRPRIAATTRRERWWRRPPRGRCPPGSRPPTAPIRRAGSRAGRPGTRCPPPTPT